MDGQLTGQQDPELGSLLSKFVRVRLIQMGGVDLSVFQFDPFLSWSLFFMNGDRTIYGRFGSAHPKTKRNIKDSNRNHTLPGLKAALRRALEVHAGYAKEPAEWTKALAGKTGPKAPWPTIESNPSAKKYGRLGRIKGHDQKGCAHCHEVQRTLIDSYLLTKRKITDDMLWVYPSPAALGLSWSRDHCARVVGVAEGSIADKAGVAVGDDIVSLHGQPMLSMADVTWVLHTFPDAGGALPAEIRRDGKTVKLAMTLPELWRQAGDFGWRYRVAGYAMWLWGGVGLADHPDGVRVAHRSPGWFKKTNRNARRRLRKGDIILEVDGKRGWTRSTYLAYLMRQKKLGSEVRLRVRRGDEVVTVRFRIPAKQPEVQGH